MKQTVWILSKQIFKKSFESKENLLFKIIQFLLLWIRIWTSKSDPDPNKNRSDPQRWQQLHKASIIQSMIRHIESRNTHRKIITGTDFLLTPPYKYRYCTIITKPLKNEQLKQ